jgi:hypothetical protein
MSVGDLLKIFTCNLSFLLTLPIGSQDYDSIAITFPCVSLWLYVFRTSGGKALKIVRSLWKLCDLFNNIFETPRGLAVAMPI